MGGGKTFHKASVLLGKTESAPSLVEAVQFHGVNFTKQDALIKEVSDEFAEHFFNRFRSSTKQVLCTNW